MEADTSSPSGLRPFGSFPSRGSPMEGDLKLAGGHIEAQARDVFPEMPRIRSLWPNLRFKLFREKLDVVDRPLAGQLPPSP